MAFGLYLLLRVKRCLASMQSDIYILVDGDGRALVEPGATARQTAYLFRRSFYPVEPAPFLLVSQSN